MNIMIKLPNLKEIMISITDVKQQLSEVVNRKMTKVIMKNNEPVSIIMPYSDYLSISENITESQNIIKGIGQDITMNNGVQMMVGVETSGEQIEIKTYIKMKTSGEYKLHHTLFLSQPRLEQSLTIDEQLALYGFNEMKEEK
jgi:PHD/YefM family antitoxin component YafN of YafNO toxin-antitoxin module